ncbi:endoplasmic oxidoreductin-1 [Coemansia sp. RSA 353]|nr:endoplasmic oxidoreductin-1 [Coemansia sp. RSA 564]KAJ2160200.1 endoplasmic oxidoreductin-1 [Coemansia sp. RSA 562]KAJ2189826.1 endoplasmic oxidoreductin-1 [Coemansia sp. RSA 532]KAJ2191425.1 endoplasmic oxidoreductin-1 [Coemansia sp. RSA 522]KAJ2197373.1 endoplasmic oxidoreductin-1 [Coemansia sp. RSA 530]KAJ2201959.1 endoplasmic oxidoreductin-1 [Coemansia sp. RSA 521]KAJ2226985.1 endoplasmic oxidoreductin-1 [Coemansia sp. RSA 518]KAJ2267433.1 endoplasmic oxidoreductin-1 [Coemansia sp. RS
MPKKRSSAARSAARTAHVTSPALALDTDQQPDVGPAKRQWLWTTLRVAALAAAAATAYIARDSPHVLGLSSRSEDPPKSPSQNIGFMAQVLQKSQGQNICKPEGFVSDTYSDFDSVEALNHRVARPLDKLVHTKFFRTLKVDLYKPCQLWRTEGSCFQRDCIVQPLDASNVPAAWCAETVDQNSFGPFLGSFPRQRPEYTDKDFAIVNDETYGDGLWVDLVENPERFTGYAGAGANAVWMSIYQDNCFGVAPYLQDTAGGWGSQLVNIDGKSMPFVQPPHKRRELAPFLENLAEEDRGVTLPADVPREYRVFYRAVSGLHASVSTHICAEYFNATSEQWEPNLGCFISRIGAFPDRLQNMYFNFVLLTRAIQKMEPYIASYDYTTGVVKDDRAVQRLIPKVLKAVRKAGLVFDDSELFLGSDGHELKAEFKENFRNISRIMDCTGCEKCRLWGKTQTLGLATALKALFSYPDRAFRGRFTSLDFKRNEVVALITTYFQFSRSLDAIEMFRGMYQNIVTDWRASQASQLPDK